MKESKHIGKVSISVVCVILGILLALQFKSVKENAVVDNLNTTRVQTLQELLDEEREGCYGVSVTEKGGETCCLSGLTDSRECAAAFLTLLIRGSVGPVGLPDVAEEWKKARHPY